MIEKQQIIYFVHKGLFPEGQLDRIQKKAALFRDVCLIDQRKAGERYAHEIFNHQTQSVETHIRLVPPTTVYLEISRTRRNATLVPFWSKYLNDEE